MNAWKRVSDPEAIFEYLRGEFLVSRGLARLRVDVVYEFRPNCYWAKEIPREVVQRSIEHALCFGVYENVSPGLARDAKHGAAADLKQVGFARVITDFATIAYLGDVFVLETHRGRGLGEWLMQCIVAHPELQGLRRWILTTRDAHGLYSQVGFTPVKWPERFMELFQADVYRKQD